MTAGGGGFQSGEAFSFMYAIIPAKYPSFSSTNNYEA